LVDLNERNAQLVAKYIIQPFESLMTDHVHFSKIVLEQNGRHHLFDSNGFSNEVREWEIQILQMEPGKCQELGVVSTQYIGNAFLLENESSSNISNKPQGARAVIGHQPRSEGDPSPFMYYGSWNGRGKTRCYRDLSAKIPCYEAGDILKVRLDVKHNKIRFFLNDEKVRSSLSLQPGNVYHPFISFTGSNSKYKLLGV